MDFSTIFNNGVAVACLIYFMYISNTTLKNVTDALNENTQIIRELKEDIKEVN